MKYSKMNWGLMEAIVNKLGGMDGVRRFLRGDLVLTGLPFQPCQWEEIDGVIYMTLPPSDGTTGPVWIERLEAGGFYLSDNAKMILGSPEFKPTEGIRHKLALVILENHIKPPMTIQEDAVSRGWIPLSLEAVCILRDTFWDEGLKRMKGVTRVIGMHDDVYGLRQEGGPPPNNMVEDHHLLCVDTGKALCDCLKDRRPFYLDGWRRSGSGSYALAWAIP